MEDQDLEMKGVRFYEVGRPDALRFGWVVENYNKLRGRNATLEAELHAAEQLCKIYFDIAIDIGFESGWSEENLRAERDKRIAALDQARSSDGAEADD